MNSHRIPLWPGRSIHACWIPALNLALVLVLVLALGGCGGGGGHDDDDDDGGVTPTVTTCDGEIFVRGPLEASDANARSLNVLGLTIRVNDRTRLANINLAALAADDFIAMRGFGDSGGEVAATCLERQTFRHEVELQGPVDAGGIGASRLSVLGVEVQVDANTVFEDGRLSQTDFLARLQPDDLVEVEGQLQADGSIRAGTIEFEDSSGGFGSDDDDDVFGDDDDDGAFDDDDDGLGDDDDDDDDGAFGDDDDDDGIGDDDDDDDDD